MFSLIQHVHIAASWLASFARPTWKPEHYPIALRRQTGVPPEATWAARVLNWPGPIGLGRTRREAHMALLENLQRIAGVRAREGKPMPRPGTKVPIEFASTARVRSDPILLRDFVVNVLGFSPRDPVFISDASSITDFGDDKRVLEICKRIEERYGVSVSEHDHVLIADLLDRIRAHK